VHALPPTYIGKETNQLEEARTGLVANVAEVLNEYWDPRQTIFSELVVPILREMPVAYLAKASNRSVRSIKAYRSGDAAPHPATRAVLIKITADYARSRLDSFGAAIPPRDLAAIAAYLDRGRRDGMN
jgi:hypothetical protein